jgi:hypothetical protein
LLGFIELLGSLIRTTVTLIRRIYEFAEEFGHLVDFQGGGDLLLGSRDRRLLIIVSLSREGISVLGKVIGTSKQ